MIVARTMMEDGLSEIAAAADLPQLDAIRVKYLGKKGLLTDALKSLGQLPDAERRTAGSALNETRDALNAALGARKQPSAYWHPRCGPQTHLGAAAEAASTADLTRCPLQCWPPC